MKTLRLPAGLRADLDAIVWRFKAGPSVSPDAAKNRRLRLSIEKAALARASALRKALAVVTATRDESGIQTTATLKVAPVSVRYDAVCRLNGRSSKGELDALAAALQLCAETLEATVPRRRGGRPADTWTDYVVSEVALACLARGVLFKDSPTCPAARVLQWEVFDRLPWIKDRSEQGLRRWLRRAIEVQNHAKK